MLRPHGTNYIFTVIVTMPDKMTKLTLLKSDKNTLCAQYQNHFHSFIVYSISFWFLCFPLMSDMRFANKANHAYFIFCNEDSDI